MKKLKYSFFIYRANRNKSEKCRDKHEIFQLKFDLWKKEKSSIIFFPGLLQQQYQQQEVKKKLILRVSRFRQ